MVTEAIHRLVQGATPVHGVPVLIVSPISTAVVVGGVFILGTDAGKEDLHMRSVLLDTAADALASAAIAVSGAVIAFTGTFYWLDSVLATGIALVIGDGVGWLLQDALAPLRTGTPRDRDAG